LHVKGAKGSLTPKTVIAPKRLRPTCETMCRVLTRPKGRTGIGNLLSCRTKMAAEIIAPIKMPGIHGDVQGISSPPRLITSMKSVMHSIYSGDQSGENSEGKTCSPANHCPGGPPSHPSLKPSDPAAITPALDAPEEGRPRRRTRTAAQERGSPSASRSSRRAVLLAKRRPLLLLRTSRC
jgi:hypothetical protein